MRSPRIALLLATGAAAAYAPILSFPFTGSSFIEIPISRVLASAHGLATLLTNSSWQFRATYAVLNSALAGRFGFDPQPFYITALVLHALATLLVYSLGRSKQLTYGSSLWAAGFFAIYEGHHAAVMSLSNWPDLLGTVFGLAALLQWITFVQSRRIFPYLAALVFYVLALFSHPGAFLWVVLFVLMAWAAGALNPRMAAGAAPFLLLSMAAVTLQILSPPRQVTWERMLMVSDPWWDTALWTAVLGASVYLLSGKKAMKPAAAAIAFIAAGLLTGFWLARIGVETTYLVSAGVALLFGMAFGELRQQVPVRLTVAAALIVLALNVAVLWSVHRRDLLAFARPTETLVNAAAYSNGPVRLSCFPYPFEIAEAAAGSVGAPLVLENGGTAPKPNCVSFSYRDGRGAVRQVYLRSQR